MAKKRNSLSTAKQYSKLLLYQATGGKMGNKPEKDDGTMTFAEKRGLLDSLVKIALLEQKDADDGPEESGMDLIRKQMAKDKENDSGKSRGTRDFGGTAEDSSDEPEPDGDTPYAPENG